MIFQVSPYSEDLPRPRSLYRGVVSDYDYYFQGKGRDEFQYSMFQYTLSGRGMFTANGKEWDMLPGMGFLCDVQDPAYAYYYPADATEPWEFFYIQLHGEPVRLMVRDVTKVYGYVYRLPLERGVVRKYRDWLESDFNGVVSVSEAMSLVNELLGQLISSVDDRDQESAESHLIDRALAVIHERRRKPLTVSELAVELGMSREHFSRLFREQLMCSPYQYIQKYRIENICWELRHETKAIKELAYEYGFSSPELFCKVFKRHVGMSPSEYRCST